MVDIIIPGVSAVDLINEAKKGNVEYNHRKAPLSQLSDCSTNFASVTHGKNFLSPHKNGRSSQHRKTVSVSNTKL